MAIKTLRSVRKEIIDVDDLLSNFGGPSEHSDRLIGIADAVRLRGVLEQLCAGASEVSARRTEGRIDISVSDHARPESIETLEGSGARVAFDSAHAVVSIPSLDPGALNGWGRWMPRTS